MRDAWIVFHISCGTSSLLSVSSKGPWKYFFHDS